MPEDTNVNVNTDGTEQTEQQEQTPQTYTAEDVAKLIQSEADKRVTQALNKQKKEYEKKLSLSKLDGDAREKAEKDQKIADLEEQIKQFNMVQQKNEVMKTLGGRNLPAELCDYLNITDDAETNQKLIEGFDKQFKAAVAAEVNKRLASGTPKENLGGSRTYKKEDAKDMSLAEMMALKKSNPEQYKALFNV